MNRFQNLKIIQSTKPNLKVRHISNLPPVQKYSVRELQRLHKQFTRDTERKRMQLFYNNIASEGDAHLFCEEFGFRVSFADFQNLYNECRVTPAIMALLISHLEEQNKKSKVIL